MNETIEPLTRARRASYAALQALWDIHAGFLRKAAYLQFSMATLGVENGVRQWQLLNALVERDSLIAGETRIAEALEPRFAAIAREAADSLRTFCEAFTGWTLDACALQPVATPAPAPRAKPRSRRSARRKPD